MDINMKPLDTGTMFSGGAGMFIQYHDIVKPVYLYAIIQMLLTDQSYGLPINIIKNISILSLLEWYLNRRYVNPLKCLDYANNISMKDMDDLLLHILSEDRSISKLAPVLNIGKMLYVYRVHHMTFPIYVYSAVEEPYIREDCKNVFQGIDCKYISGDLKSAIEKCDQNFTYIFSDIELAKNAAEILYGTCSHILIARDYRYNYTDYRRTFKYDLPELQRSHPFIRVGTTLATDPKDILTAYANL